RKGVTLMNRKFSTMVCVAVLVAVVVPASGALGAGSGAGSGTAVTVRVEGLKRTLLMPTVVHVNKTGSVTKGGAPAGACPASSAAGALDIATKHHWDGSYSASLKDIFIKQIL